MFRTSAAVRSHLKWVNGAADAVLPPAGRAEIHRLAAAVAARVHDPNLRIGMFGQFSSGKSTLLNALIGARLLPSSALATTAVATTLRRARRDDLTVVLKSGGTRLDYGTDGFKGWYRDRVAERPPPDMRTALKHIMRSGPARDSLAGVEVAVAGTLLGKRVVLVDTPGFDSADPRHHESAAAVAAEVDLAIVLIPAGDPGSMALEAFLGGVLRDLGDRCVFVLTKFRHVDPEERDDLQEHVVSWLADAGFPQALVLRADATDIAVAAHDGRAPEGAAEALRESRMLARTLRDLAASRHGLLIRATLDVLLRKLLAEVTRAAQERQAALAGIRAGLAGIHIADLDAFLAQWGVELAAEARHHASSALAEAAAGTGPDGELARALDRAADAVGRRVFAGGAVRTLIAETETVLRSWASAAVRDATDRAVAVLDADIDRLHGDFARQYADLASLAGGQVAGPGPGGLVPVVAAPYIELRTVVASLTAAGENLDLRGLGKTGGAAAAGAAVGTLIVPVFGTVIGAAVGALFGLGRGQEVRRLRETAEPMHRTAVAAARQAVIDAGPTVGSVLAARIDDVLSRYASEAKPVVTRLLGELHTRIAATDAALRRSGDVLDEAQRRHHALTPTSAAR